MDIILISWQALAFVFAILPGIAGIAYCFECGQRHVPPTFKDYMTMFKMARKAKSDAYKKTGETLMSTRRRGLAKIFAGACMIIVVLLGPGIWITGTCLILAIPASALSYYIGKRMR